MAPNNANVELIDGDAPLAIVRSYMGADLPPSQQLVDFLRGQVDSFENQREHYLKALDEMRISRQDYRKKEWELRHRREDIEELQQALSEANMKICQERERNLKLLAENDQLRIQEVESRRRISDLLVLTQPATQEVTYFRDCRPDKMAHYPRTSNGPNDQQHAPQPRRTPEEGRRVLRTIYLPNEQLDNCYLTIESLQAQLEEQRVVFEEKIRFLEIDRKMAREESAARAQRDKDKIVELEDSLHQTQDTLAQNTKQSLLYRHDREKEMRQLREECDQLRSQEKVLHKEVKVAQKQVVQAQKVAHSMAEEKTEVYVAKYRNQAAEKDQELMEVKEKTSNREKEYEARIKDLEFKIRNLIDRYKKLDLRRRMDFEGFANDIRSIRFQLRKNEKKLFFIHPIPDIPVEMTDAARKVENVKQRAMRLTEELSQVPE
eukprot:GFYU01048353.1.p1 GENE.GFYU01048353.1~~GFYU01048353.1.p1  ORF type:complete len:456 (+),score=155.02 GFYU01048353.1:67-1368(+)